MYNRDKEDHSRRLTEKALSDYIGNVNDITAGYNILRYAAKGWIALKDGVNPSVFMDWYPRDMSFVILRLALDGKLSYKEKE